MGKGRTPRITPKANLNSKNRDEVGTFDSALKRGHSRVYIDECKSKERNLEFKNPEFKEKMMDFIFGNTDENPMDEINKKFKSKSDNLDKKKYSKVGVVSFYEDKDLDIMKHLELDESVHNIEDIEDTEELERESNAEI